MLLARPGVAEQVRETGVRYVVWVDGSTDRVASGGGITCAAGVGGAGCMGLAWWEDDSRYDLTVWDVKDIENEGTIYADYKGRSVMPAIVIPIPLITRPQNHACRGLTDQLRQFLTTPEGYSVAGLGASAGRRRLATSSYAVARRCRISAVGRICRLRLRRSAGNALD